MTNWKNLWNKYKELILYVVFGALTTLVNFVSFALLNPLSSAEGWYLIANAIAWVIAVVFAYLVNKLFVFESKSFAGKVLWKEIPSFVGARVLSFLLEEGGLLLFVDLLHWDEFQLPLGFFVLEGMLLIKLFLAVIVIVLNYIFSKLFIFKK